MKRMAVLSILVSLAAGCSSDTPLEVVTPFEPGTWSGTFFYIADFGSQGSVSQSGMVTFHFSGSEYVYEANVTELINRSRLRFWGPGTFLRDRGSLTKDDRTARMEDFANLRAAEVPQRSLYLHGSYSYSAFGKSLSFSKQERGASLTVKLSIQN